MKMTAALALACLSLRAAETKAPDTAAALYDSSKVWTVHLNFTAEQWQAMQPSGGGPGRGPGGFGGGPGRGPGGGRGGFGQAIAPAFLKGDSNRDGKLSTEEFRALGEQWFAAWDKDKSGRLTEEQVRAGIGAELPMPGGPGRGPGGPGGPGGPPVKMGVEFPYAHADLDFSGTVFRDIAVRDKGNSTYMQSRGTIKVSMKLDLNKYVKGQKLAGLGKVNLHSNVTDPGWMNETIAYRLFRDAGIAAPRTSFARVYLTVEGKYKDEYAGLYSVVEEVDAAFAKDRFAASAGAIFKPSTQAPFAYLGDDWAKYDSLYDPKTALSDSEKNRFIAFAKLVTSGSDEEFEKQLPAYFDIDEAARYFAINTWLVNLDSIFAMGHNYYLHLDKSGKFTILPWDLDLSFGGFGGGTELAIERPWRGENRFLDRLYQAPEFHERYLAHMKEYNSGMFNAERLTKQVDEIASVIRPAVKEEAGKLEAFDSIVAGKPVVRNGDFGGGRGPGGPGGGPGGGGPRGTPIKAFVAPRVKSVAAQLAGESKGDNSGGFGPGGRGGPGGPMMMMNPSAMLAPLFVSAMDQNKDGILSREEVVSGLARWHKAWGDGADSITEEQLRAGITKDLAPQPPPPGN